jgi:hypothetical protein
MGEVAQLITAIGGAVGVILAPIVTLIIALRGKTSDDQAQNARLAELEALLAQRRSDGDTGGAHRAERDR